MGDGVSRGTVCHVMPAPIPVAHPLAFLDSPNCFSLCSAEGFLPESRQELPFTEHLLGARICSKHFAESPHLNLMRCEYVFLLCPLWGRGYG